MKHFIINVSWTLVGLIAYNTAQWGLLIFFNKFYSLADLGLYSLILGFASPVFLFFNMNIKFAILQDFDPRIIDMDRRALYSSIRWQTSLAAVLVTLLIAICFKLYLQQTIWVLLALVLHKWTESFFEFNYGFFQLKSQMRVIGQSQIVRGLIVLICIFLTWCFSLSSSAMLVLSAILALIFLLGNEGFANPSLPNLNWRGTNFFFSTYYPLALIASTESLSLNVQKFFLNNISGQEAVGVFTSLILLVQLVDFVLQAVLNTTLPRIKDHIKRYQTHELLKDIKKILAFAGLLSLIYLLFAVFFGRYFLTIVYSSEMAIYYKEMVSVGVLALLLMSVSIFNYGLYAAAKFKQILFINILTMVVLVILCFILVTKWGIIGAIWATIGSQGFRLIMQIIQFKKIVYGSIH